MRPFASVFVYAADFGQHTDISLKSTLHRDYALRLFIGNEELELQTQDNQTWTPAQRPYVPCFPTMHTHGWLCTRRGVSPTSEMRAAIQMRRHHSFWAKNRSASEAIDLQEVLNDYWGTSERIFTVPSRSYSPAVRSYLMAKRRGHYFRWKAPPASLVSRITILCEQHRSSDLFETAHPGQLMIFA